MMSKTPEQSGLNFASSERSNSATLQVPAGFCIDRYASSIGPKRAMNSWPLSLFEELQADSVFEDLEDFFAISACSHQSVFFLNLSKLLNTVSADNASSSNTRLERVSAMLANQPIQASETEDNTTNSPIGSCSSELLPDSSSPLSDESLFDALTTNNLAGGAKSKWIMEELLSRWKHALEPITTGVEACFSWKVAEFDEVVRETATRLLRPTSQRAWKKSTSLDDFALLTKKVLCSVALDSGMHSISTETCTPEQILLYFLSGQVGGAEFAKVLTSLYIMRLKWYARRLGVLSDLDAESMAHDAISRFYERVCNFDFIPERPNVVFSSLREHVVNLYRTERRRIRRITLDDRLLNQPGNDPSPPLLLERCEVANILVEALKHSLPLCLDRMKPIDGIDKLEFVRKHWVGEASFRTLEEEYCSSKSILNSRFKAFHDDLRRTIHEYLEKNLAPGTSDEEVADALHEVEYDSVLETLTA